MDLREGCGGGEMACFLEGDEVEAGTLKSIMGVARTEDW